MDILARGYEGKSIMKYRRKKLLRVQIKELIANY